MSNGWKGEGTWQEGGVRGREGEGRGLKGKGLAPRCQVLALPLCVPTTLLLNYTRNISLALLLIRH